MQDFLAIIRKYGAGYVGDHARYMANFESLYILTNELLRRERLEPEDRVLAFAAIGYVSVIDNAIAVRDVGPEGYLDDIYLLCVVLRRLLKTNDSEDLYEFWNGPDDLLDLLGESFVDFERKLGGRARRTMEFAGLPKRLLE